MVWRRNKLQVPWKGRNPGPRERWKNKVHRDMHKNTSTMPLTGKTRGANFYEFLQSRKCKDWRFIGLRLGWDRDLRVLPYSWREGRQGNPEACCMIKGLPKVHRKRLFFLEHISEKWDCLFRVKRTSQHHFSSCHST